MLFQQQLFRRPASAELTCDSHTNNTLEVRLLDHPRIHIDSLGPQIKFQGSTVVVGPSGAGKSTLLRCLAGLEPYHGLIELGGEPLTTVGPSRGVAMAWQDPHLIGALTVADNLRISGPLDPSVIKLFGLGPLLARRPGQISGGEAQRVNLARALLAPARVVLLDEPMQGQDPVMIRKLLGKIKSYCTQTGRTLVLVTHELDHAYGIFERCVVLKNAQVQAAGDLQDLHDNPNSPWLANFFGPYFILDRQDLAHFAQLRPLYPEAVRPCLVRPSWLRVRRGSKPNAKILSIKWQGPVQKINVRLLGTGKPLTVEENTDSLFNSGEEVNVKFNKCSYPMWV